jgi:hypothetical protein
MVRGGQPARARDPERARARARERERGRAREPKSVCERVPVYFRALVCVTLFPARLSALLLALAVAESQRQADGDGRPSSDRGTPHRKVRTLDTAPRSLLLSPFFIARVSSRAWLA